MAFLDWSTADAVALRSYIAVNPGFIEALRNRLPKIEGLTMEARAVTGSEVKGYLAALEEIGNLMREDAPDTEAAGFIP